MQAFCPTQTPTPPLGLPPQVFSTQTGPQFIVTTSIKAQQLIGGSPSSFIVALFVHFVSIKNLVTLRTKNKNL